MECAISLNTLRAAALFASTEETRYYLCGVAIEVRQHNVTYIATDGHRLFARCLYNHAHQNHGADDENAETKVKMYIIPAHECARFKVGKKADDWATLDDITAPGERTKLRLSYAGTAVTFEPVDGTFPDWRRVLPNGETETHAAVCVDWEKMSAFDKASKLLDLGPAIMHLGMRNGPQYVSYTRDLDTFGVIMPKGRNGEEPRPSTPTYARVGF